MIRNEEDLAGALVACLRQSLDVRGGELIVTDPRVREWPAFGDQPSGASFEGYQEHYFEVENAERVRFRVTVEQIVWPALGDRRPL